MFRLEPCLVIFFRANTICGVRRTTEARNPKRKSNVDPKLVQNLEAVLELEAILEANPNPNLNLNQENESEAKPGLSQILGLVPSRDRAHIKDENLDPGTFFGQTFFDLVKYM